MYYAIMDLTESKTMCCNDPVGNRKCITYQFSVIIVDDEFNVLNSLCVNSCQKELHNLFKAFLEDANEYMHALHGVFFGQKIKKLLKQNLNMKEMTPREKAFVFDSVNLRSGFSELLSIEKLDFKTFFKIHDIAIPANGKDSFANVLSILKVLNKYENVNEILGEMIRKEKNYQFNKIKKH